MRLAVVGSVNVSDIQRKIAEDIIIGFYVRNNPALVISGGAEGIDTIAERLAKDVMLIETKIYLPEEPNWHKGYKPRNLEIAGNCTHLLCIRTEQSTTYGSGWTADRAAELGKTVWRVTI